MGACQCFSVASPSQQNTFIEANDAIEATEHFQDVRVPKSTLPTLLAHRVRKASPEPARSTKAEERGSEPLRARRASHGCCCQSPASQSKEGEDPRSRANEPARSSYKLRDTVFGHSTHSTHSTILFKSQSAKQRKADTCELSHLRSHRSRDSVVVSLKLKLCPLLQGADLGLACQMLEKLSRCSPTQTRREAEQSNTLSAHFLAMKWRNWNPFARGRRSLNLEWEPSDEVNPTGEEAPPTLVEEDDVDELNELNLHTIQRQSSPRHEVGEPMDFGAVSPEFFGASATVKMEMGHHGHVEELNEGTSTWQCGLSSACDTFPMNCCRDTEETVGDTNPSKGPASRPNLVSTGVQTEPISKKHPEAKGPEEKEDVLDFDFRTLLHLAEQRRGRPDPTASVPAPTATGPTLRRPAPVNGGRARKVSVMPSPDDHFLSLERERRAEKHEIRQAMSPTSPTSELDYVYLDPSRYFGSKARGGDTPSQMFVWSLTRT
eukprot:s2891_g5.t1